MLNSYDININKQDGATTLSIVTLRITTFSIVTFSVVTFSIVTFSIVTFSKVTLDSDIQHIDILKVECMVFLLSVITLNGVAPLLLLTLSYCNLGRLDLRAIVRFS